VYDVEPVYYVLDPYALDEGDVGSPWAFSAPRLPPRRLPARAFHETERAARARAEVDPATRDRITWAHEHLSKSTGIHPARARRGALRGMTPAGLAMHVERAGLTLGEAEAAGIGK
jgi:hypothetical protein